MAEYGYVRISTKKQNIDRQVRNIKAAFPEALIVAEAYTGTSMNRPEWIKLVNKIKRGDTVVFDSVSRMSRDAAEGFQTYQQLFDQGITLVFLKEPQINTETYKKALEGNIGLTGTAVDCILEGINKYMLELAREQIRIAFDQSEKEVKDIRQRTSEGVRTAQLNGKRVGCQRGDVIITRKSVESKRKILEYSKDFQGTLTDQDCIKLIGLARNTFYKYKREMKQGA